MCVSYEKVIHLSLPFNI
ncbi:rCG27920, partial [Rattus norvegicus]